MNLGPRPRALILGSSGFLGRRVLEAGGSDFAPLRVTPVRSRQDLRRLEGELAAEMLRAPEATVVNCIGSRDGSHGALELLNVEVPETLVRVATAAGSRIVHLGSAAEIAQFLESAAPQEGLAAMSAYGETKRAGTQACLTYPGATVLRIYNIHGLAHQPTSGVHRLCEALAAAASGGAPANLVNTTRDYVHWREVTQAVDAAVGRSQAGLVEVCSGVGISMEEILSGLPPDLVDSLRGHLVPPDLLAPVIGPARPLTDMTAQKERILAELRTEVVACAFS